MRNRQGRIKISSAEHSETNAAMNSTFLNAATNGVLVPDSHRHEYSHFITTGLNKSGWNIYGRDQVSGTWFYLDHVDHTSSWPESTRVTGAACWDRVASIRTDANECDTGINAYWGWSEA
jgi:hypothetical protein